MAMADPAVVGSVGASAAVGAAGNAQMPVHMIFEDGVSESVREAFRIHWQRKWPRIERLLQHFPPDQRHLRLVIHNHHPIWDARAVLTLSSGTLVANGRSRGDDYREALDMALDRLAEEVRRHKGLLRHDYLYHRKNRRQRDFAGIGAEIEQQYQQRDRQAFGQLLLGVLRNLQDHAHHELVIAQLEGLIRPNELSVSDVLDEVVARAYERWEDRPAEPLEQWLTRLLHEVIDSYAAGASRVAHGAPPQQAPPPQPTEQPERIETAEATEAPPLLSPQNEVSLEEVIPPDDPRFQVDSGWIIENEPYWPELEPLTLEQVLPDQEVAEPWQELSAEEQRQQILLELSRFPREQRRAFMLHALEGWDPDDIATFQQRPLQDVRRDIELIRQHLREKFQKSAD
ncbi:integrase [Fontivita pretiosa]|uniref:integrase n=1 Tax=Fontivita pretiosa TaxID=2989684 RepID=UPI003D179346